LEDVPRTAVDPRLENAGHKVGGGMEDRSKSLKGNRIKWKQGGGMSHSGRQLNSLNAHIQGFTSKRASAKNSTEEREVQRAVTATKAMARERGGEILGEIKHTQKKAGKKECGKKKAAKPKGKTLSVPLTEPGAGSSKGGGG